MAEIKLQFVLENALSSRIIAWYGAAQYSHVDCLLDDGTLLGARSDAVGGKPPGVQVRPQGYAKWINRKVMTVSCTSGQKKSYNDFLYSQLEKPYDDLAIWGFFVGRDWREDDSWICSEIQSRAGEVSTILQRLFIPTSRITPPACGVAFSAVGGVTQ